jgi:hypothetical protein
MKIGDKVRFLSEVGGGRVSGFHGKDIVLVEDEDGFDVPMRITEVVIIGEEDYDTRHVVEMKQKQKAQSAAPRVEEEETEPADRPITFRAKPEERKGGDKLSAFLAFVPMNVKELTQTRFESYLINDSNYYLRYTLLSAEGLAYSVRATGEVEPNTKAFIEEFGREDLQGLERLCVQMLAYKRDKHFMLKPPVNVPLRIDGVKFYKLHTFEENDFFEEPALIYTIIENDVQKVKI